MAGSYTYIQESDQKETVSQAITLAVTMHYFLTESVVRLLDLELHQRLEECVRSVLARACPDAGLTQTITMCWR